MRIGEGVCEQIKNIQVCTTLTPSKVLDNTVCIQLDPDIEEDKEKSRHPPEQVAKESGVCWKGDPGQCKANVGREVVHEDQVYKLTVE